TKETNFKVAGIGELLRDMLPEGKQQWQPIYCTPKTLKNTRKSHAGCSFCKYSERCNAKNT
ncbi:MAG TPA: hypothetical protein VLQ91_21135, partial [Draconibacterium sp.]|nr:hypothetical protein [Draconibacterium sp.]